MTEETELKMYMLDTNVFRYKTIPGSHYKREAKRFWRMALEEVKWGKASLITPVEVVRELGVQSYTLYDREIEKLEALMETLEVTDEISTIELEHHVRKMSAFVRANYKEDIDVGKGVYYPSVSDARILLSAYENDCVLVTANIKDFMLYPLLFPVYEDRLFDILDTSYITIHDSVHNDIHNDLVFQDMVNELNEKMEELVID